MSLSLGRLLLALAAAAPPATAAPPAADADADEAVYLRRFAESGINGRESYDTMEDVPGAARPRALPQTSRPTLSTDARDRAAAYALANASQAMLIWRDGALEQAVYGQGAGPATLLNARSMAKPLGALAVGRAIALGKLRSLDQPAAEVFTEWRDGPKAAITLRQILAMTSGLAGQVQSRDPQNLWSREYLHPRHGRLLLEEHPLTAVPGARYQYANASAELIAPLIERATGRRYAEFVSSELLQPLGAAGGQVWVDRIGGLAHSGCCILLPAETWLRLGVLLLNDGVWEGRRLLPPGYVAAMKTPSAANPRYGLGVWLPGEYVRRRSFGAPEQTLGSVLHGEPYAAPDLFLFDGNADQVLYMVPSRRLAILRMGGPPPKSPEWDNAVLPNLVLRDLASSASR